MKLIYSRIEAVCDKCGFLYGSCEQNALTTSTNTATTHTKNNADHVVRVNVISTVSTHVSK